MEPRSIERGNVAPRLADILRPAASMEPRSIERGNMSKSACASSRRTRLQWSHVQLNVETRETNMRLRPFGCWASMEPRSIERGNKNIRLCGACDFLGLQWSHVQLNVETAHEHVLINIALAPLQWSHVQLNVETVVWPRPCCRKL